MSFIRPSRWPGVPQRATVLTAFSNPGRVTYSPFSKSSLPRSVFILQRAAGRAVMSYLLFSVHALWFPLSLLLKEHSSQRHGMPKTLAEIQNWDTAATQQKKFLPAGKAIRIHNVVADQSTGTVLSSCPSGRGGGMADATDLKSVGSNPVWVRVPPSAPMQNQLVTGSQRSSANCPFLYFVCPVCSVRNALGVNCLASRNQFARGSYNNQIQ